MQRQSAAHIQCLAGDVAGIVRCQKRGHGGDFRGVGGAAHRNVAFNGVAALGIGSVQVRERIVATLPALSGNADGVNSALAGRGRIWDGALCMVREHPFNGVGVRGFREAWPQCDPAPGQPAEWGDGPALHAHQLLLEVLAETGVLGLLLWLAGAAMAWRAWRYADAAARERARPAAVALLVTVFPFNTHLAFYSAFWGSVTLLLAALYAGSLLADERQ